MSYQPWYYFLSLERDFIETINFVHLSTDNEGVYSFEYAKLLLLVGSETDVVAKLLCTKIDASKRAENIVDYRTVIVAAFPGMHATEIEVSRYPMKVEPWLTWDPSVNQSPEWWKAYNAVKHGRDTNFSQANQRNALHALSGLLVLLLYYYKDEGHLQPYPAMLEFGFPKGIVTGRTKRLPGT